MRLPWGATIATSCGVAILIGLGTWQVHRLHWKEEIIQRLSSGYEMAGRAQPLPPAQLETLSQDNNPIAYGMVKGRLERDKAILLGGRIHDGRPGYSLLIPMDIDGARPLIVNAGWVDILWSDNTEDRLNEIPSVGEEVIVSGILRKPDWSSFASRNSPENDIWFRADIDQIAAAKGIENPYPYILYADHTEPAFTGVLLQEEQWLPRNKHLQYALFWYALAICLAGVYGFYVREWNKKKAP